MAHNVHLSDVAAILRLRNYLKKYGPFDLFHCHSTKAGFVGRIAALGAGCPVIYTPNAFVTMSPFASAVSRAGARVVEAVLGFTGDGVICVSDEEVTHARSLGVRTDRIFLVQNGVDLPAVQAVRAQRAQIRERFGLSEGEICVGFVGRLFPQKSPAVLVDAFARAVHDLPPAIKLVIVGDGPLLGSLRSQVERLGLADRTSFVGGMNGVLAMSAFDIYALPSYFEGFPYVLIEAIAMGLPVVSTAVGGASALVRSGENGFVVPVGAAEEFGAALHKLLADEYLRDRMAAGSLALSNRFNLGRMLNETIQVYRHILETPESRSAVGSST